MSCIITYKNNKYTEQEFKQYIKNNFFEFSNSINNISEIQAETSKVKDIVYHALVRGYDFDKFNSELGNYEKAIFFFKNLSSAKIWRDDVHGKTLDVYEKFKNKYKNSEYVELKNQQLSDFVLNELNNILTLYYIRDNPTSEIASTLSEPEKLNEYIKQASSLPFVSSYKHLFYNSYKNLSVEQMKKHHNNIAKILLPLIIELEKKAKIINAIINIKNPEIVKNHDYIMKSEEGENLKNLFRNRTGDSVILENATEFTSSKEKADENKRIKTVRYNGIFGAQTDTLYSMITDTQYAVFEPEQIYILNSDKALQDMDSFMKDNSTNQSQIEQKLLDEAAKNAIVEERIKEDNRNKQFQKQSTTLRQDLIAEESAIRDLAARMAYRIGGTVKFESDLTKDYSGYNEGKHSVINLAKATLDTPIHEILAHPIIRAIKNKLQKRKYDFPFKVQKALDGTFYVIDNDGFQTIEPFKTYQEARDYEKEQNNNFNRKVDKYNENLEKSANLYQNLLKELESGYGKEVLDRVKKRYVYKDNGLKQKGQEVFQNGKLITAFFNEEDTKKYVEDNSKYTLEEQQEEALVQLLGELTAGKIKETKENKNLISLLKQLLKEMTEYMRSLFNSKEIEIDKLRADMTLNDLANLLAYSNSKIILPGNRVEYTTPDNQKFATYQEASNHISKLFNESKDVDLSAVKIQNQEFRIPNNINYFTVVGLEYLKENEEWFISFSGERENLQKTTLEEATQAYKQGYLEDTGELIDKNSIKNFIERNKQFEQAKKIIEQWKKENNIQYDPEEVYSRGQGFYSSIGAYSNLELDLLLKNLIQHIKDNKKAGGEFTISAFTRPINKRLKHIEGTGDRIRFVIYPKSEHIKWAAPTDVYSGSVWDASEKVSKDKKSELLGVSFTKAPALRNINEVSPNLADIIDNLSHDHNELGIELTTNNFRIEYDDNIDYSTKKLIDNINKILDDKYGKLEKPEIKKPKDKIQQVTAESFEEVNQLKAEGWIEIGKSEEGFPLFQKENTNNIAKQPTQTKENTTSIESIKSKFVNSKLNDWKIIPGPGGKDMNWAVEYRLDDNADIEFFDTEQEARDFIKSLQDKKVEEKEYTSQALTNLKVAALKEIARKYPRSLITSKVINNTQSERQYQRSSSINYKLKLIEGLEKFITPQEDKRTRKYGEIKGVARQTLRLNSKQQPNIETNIRKALNNKGVTNQQIDLLFDYMRSNKQSFIENKIKELENNKELEIDCKELKAQSGLTNTVKGTGWKLTKEFKGKSHAEGGIDITLNENGYHFRRNGKDIKAANGLIIENK